MHPTKRTLLPKLQDIANASLRSMLHDQGLGLLAIPNPNTTMAKN